MFVSRVCWKLLTGVLLVIAGPYMTRAGEVYSAAVQLSSFNLLFARVTINDRPVLALVDFGSPFSVELSSSLALRMGIKPADKIKVFRIGDYEARQLPAEVNHERIEKIAARFNTSFDVIVGWGFFSRFNVLLDYKNSMLQFSDVPFTFPSCQYHFGYAEKNGVPVIEGVRVDTARADFLFDTGAPMSNIDVSIARYELPGATISKVITIDKLSFEPIFRVMDLELIRRAAGCRGILGNNFLAGYTVCINRAQRTISLRDNDYDTARKDAR